VFNLTPGVHNVTLTTANGSVQRQVTVEAGVTASLVISSSGPGAFASGWLALSSPVPAQVIENGTVVGTTDAPRLLLPTGRHDLEIKNASLGYSVQRTVHIAAGQTTSIKLDAPRTPVHINALPWAEVWVDGTKMGETPLANLSLVLGTHELIFRHPQFGEQRRTITVALGAPVRVGVDMRKAQQ
jgi:hypothetical protein